VIWQIDLLLFAVVIVTAVLALRIADLLGAVAVLAAYSLFVGLLFAGMGAVDVAFVEVVLGAGVTGLLFIATILVAGRRPDPSPGGARSRPLVVVALVGAFVALMLFASTDLPDRGDPQAPAHQHVAPDYLSRSLDDTGTPNVVTAVLADYRSHDTFGETLVIFTAALAALLILGRREEEPDDRRT
jgi:multicomponent Na+:H+ antiporter subunit B